MKPLHPLKQEDYILMIVKDLGMLLPTTTAKQKKRFAIFLCECGKEFKTQVHSIKSGNSKMCKDCGKQFNKTHGDGTTKSKHYRLYQIWHSMIDRCYNENNKDFKYYGGRGIIVYEKWKEDYTIFKAWALVNSYSTTLTIERKNGDKNYTPENCKWATMLEQAQNTKCIMTTNTSGYRGVSWNKAAAKWKACIGVNKKIIHLGYYTDKIEAAKQYNKYVIDNKLKHTINKI